MYVDTEIILDWQQRGITARILGLAISDSPLLNAVPQNDRQSQDEWDQKMEAWLFGWSIEDAMRH
jgi:hypothetical protein